MNIKTEADIKRLGLICNFYSVDDIAEWANELIASEDEISEYKIFDIAGGSKWSMNDMSSALREISSNEDHSKAQKKLFSIFLDFAKVSEKNARIVSSCLFNLASILKDSAYLTSFKDQYDDLDAGIYGDEKKIWQDLITFLDEEQKNPS